jgi:MFS family permease
VYPLVWSVLQIGTGWLADRVLHSRLIALGMAIQALGLGLMLVVNTFFGWLACTLLLGLGTALVYPTLIAVVSQAAAPTWRARALGIYRFWRDVGYAVGALVAGLLADALGFGWAIGVVAALTFFSGLVMLAKNQTV